MSRRFEYHIEEADAGLTVEEFLLKNEYSKRLIIVLKQTSDGICIDGSRTRTTALLKQGDLFAVTLPEKEKKHSIEKLTVPVIYEDNDIVIFNKPAGIACHRSGCHAEGTLENMLEGTLCLVYRLDKDTSGLLLVAKHQLAASRLWRSVKKKYIAIVSGKLVFDEGIISMPIEREAPFEMKRIVTDSGLQAITGYRVLARGENAEIVECTPFTGRTHQIRVHFSQLGHPLLGDSLYNGDCTLLDRHALHCGSIEFNHPITGEKIQISAEFPEDMQRIANKIYGGTYEDNR